MNAAFRSRRANGFTLFEMMISLGILLMLAGAVFGILSGVLSGASTLQDNLARHDRMSALSGFMKKRLTEMPADSTLFTYRRGNGEGLDQNGIIFGTPTGATVLDGKVQPNGYYTLRMAIFTTADAEAQHVDARQALLQAASGDDSSLIWTVLVRDVKTIGWKFEDYTIQQWVDTWDSNSAKPTMAEVSLQLAGDLQPTTMDFWLPNVQAVGVNAPNPNATP